ncbi:MAG: hypothetical protein K9H06_11710, partial [Melioribacteraceae bacterium]|nr:hypothetical protein [Melioribacteraceae bacterium]
MKYIFFILLIILTNIIFAQQDSLFLIHTIVGQDTENPIRRFGSIGDINGDNSPDFFVAYPKY